MSLRPFQRDDFVQGSIDDVALITLAIKRFERWRNLVSVQLVRVLVCVDIQGFLFIFDEIEKLKRVCNKYQNG